MPYKEQARAGVERLCRILDAALLPGGAVGLLTRKPRSVAAMRLTSSLAGRGLQFSSVIDVGANVGQFSRAALGLWPQAQIVAFEALPACARQLEQSLVARGHVEVHAVAVGREDGSITFHPHEYSLSSSVLPATAEARRDHHRAREVPSIEVPLSRLDTVLSGRSLPRPTLLKLDVQGFELEVLAGAERTLESIDAVLVEVAFERVYEGQPLFGDVHEQLVGRGWTLSAPLDARREDGQIVELDCLYQRAPSVNAMTTAETT